MAKKVNVSINGSDYYRVRCKIGTKPNGQRILKPFYGSSKKEAEKARDEYLADIRKGMAIDADKIPFGDIFEEWLTVIHRPRLSANSWTRYESIHRLYIKPTTYYNMKLQDVRSLHIQREINKLKSPFNAEWVHLLLAMFFKYVIKERLIHFSPLDNVSTPKRPESLREKLYMNHDEIELLTTAFKSSHDLFVYVFAAFTGLRQGEIFALTHRDIDFDKGLITVSKSLKRVTVDSDEGRESVILVGPTKTNSGNRQIPIFENLIVPLKRQIALEKEKHMGLGVKYTSKALLFSSRNLVALRSDHLTSRWKRIQEQIGIEEVTFHALRHTFCTMLCESNVPLKTASNLMGHTNIDMVAKIYAHVGDRSKEIAIQSLKLYYK